MHWLRLVTVRARTLSALETLAIVSLLQTMSLRKSDFMSSNHRSWALTISEASSSPSSTRKSIRTARTSALTRYIILFHSVVWRIMNRINRPFVIASLPRHRWSRLQRDRCRRLRRYMLKHRYRCWHPFVYNLGEQSERELRLFEHLYWRGKW